MSELKYYKLFHRTSALTSPEFISVVEFGAGDEVYLKSEVDKVIADITKGAISMFKESSCCRGLDLKSSLGKIADAAFKHWCYVESIQQKCIQFEIDKQLSQQLRNQLYDKVERLEAKLFQQATQISHQKYKRCLDVARRCHNESLWWYSKGYGFEKYDKFWEKWEKRWLKIAEKFKEGV